MIQTGFNAMGLPVPSNRLKNAYKTVKEIMPQVDNELAYSIVAKCSNMIKNDECFGIVGAIEGLDKDLATIDLTGRYRLLAVLLTDA